jgi:hypothetical protein
MEDGQVETGKAVWRGAGEAVRMEPASLAAVVLGSAILIALAASVAVDGIRNKSTGKAISAIDGRWKKLKVEIPPPSSA